MVNLSECKFGDKLKTRDGRMAVFLGTDAYPGLDGVLHEIYYCAMARWLYMWAKNHIVSCIS